MGKYIDAEKLKCPHNIYDVMLYVALYFANWKK